MKTPLKYLAIVALATAALTWLAVKVTSTEPESEGESDRGNVAAREAFRRLQLQDENGQIPPNALIDAYKQKKDMPFLPEAWAEFDPGNELSDEASEPGDLKLADPGILIDGHADIDPDASPWVSFGPNNYSGIIRSLIIHPDFPNTPIMWAGASSGGVWKSTDAGSSWNTGTDFLANIGIHCLAIDPTNPQILYAGTGDGFRGDGIFKTTDGGSTWVRLESTNPINNGDFYHVNRLAICPTNTQLLLAATTEETNYVGKIYRSTDGGATWSLTLDLYPAIVTNILDVRFQPSGPTPLICMAGTTSDGAYYSGDLGLTWTRSTWAPSPPGYPSGRVELAYSRSDPSIVYASVSTNGGQLYRSTNGGLHFEVRSPGPPTGVGGAPGGTTAWGRASVLWVDPTNPETVIVGGVYMYRSTAGGNGSWTEASSIGTHPDHHLLVEDPRYNGGTGGTPNATVFGVNDGGIYRTTDILATPTATPIPPVTWTGLHQGLVNSQFYGAAGHVASGRIIGGTQDNGTLVSQPLSPGSSPPPNWTLIAGSLGGDGGFCAVDQGIEPYFYGEFFFLQIYRSIDGGYTKHFIHDADPARRITDTSYADVEHGFYANAIAPFILDPNDGSGNTILAGGSSLWRSTNVKQPQPSWYPIKDPIVALGQLRNISAIAVAPGNSDIIWVGHNNGSVYYTTNGTSSMPSWTEADAGLPHGLGHMCTRIAIGSQNPLGKRPVYATFAGFFPSPLDSKGNVWKTVLDGSSITTWTDIHHNLPSTPIYSLVISPSTPDLLYIGTEIGTFATGDGGTTWSPGNGGPANVPVFELFWMGPKLVAVTHGRGIFTTR